MTFHRTRPGPRRPRGTVADKFAARGQKICLFYKMSQNTRLARLSWIAYQECPDINIKWHEWQDRKKGKEPSDLAWQKANCDWEPLKDAVEPPQFTTCSTTDAQAYAFKMGPGDPLILACRGTSSFQDALVDLCLQLVPFVSADGSPEKGVSVHRGFYGQFKGIMPQVDKLYRGHLAGGGTLLCIGHSLGSSVAALVALYYGQLHPGKVSYVGFGTPRVGNGEFVKLFNSVVKNPVRVVNGRDPINKIPPPICYAHICPETRVGRSDPYPAIPMLSDLPDHDILKGYIHNLANPAAEATVVPKQFSNWFTEAISRFRA